MSTFNPCAMIKTLTSVFATLLLSFLMNAQQVVCIDCTLIDPNAFCISIFDPVCGCDGVTYSNSCVAETSAGTVIYTGGECPPNGVYMCSDLAGVDLGLCDQVLGFAMVNGECVTVSGCSTIGEDEVEYAGAIFPDPESCLESCLCGVANGLEESDIEGLSMDYDAGQSALVVVHTLPGNLNLSITDMSGRLLVVSQMRSDEPIDLSFLASGPYIASLAYEGRIVLAQQIYVTK